MRTCKIAGMLLLILCLTVCAEAAPSLEGETGNLKTPSADLMRSGQFHAGWYSAGELHGLSAAVPLTNMAELSLQQSRLHGQVYTAAGIKYQLRSEGVYTPGIAVGAEDITAERQRSVYAVVSKTFPYGVRLHAGIGSGRLDHGFAALEVRLLPKLQPGVFPDATVYAEQVEEHGVYGMRLALFRGAKLSFGIDGAQHFVGISYNFY